MATSTVEQYIKTIFNLHQATGARVQTQHIAERLGVTPGTATVMIKHLAKLGLVEYTPRHGVLLTADGEKMALRMLRYHRLIETFLARIVGYDWSEIHEEAEVLEHAVSERFIAKIDALLGRPSHDPHGDPIPAADGRLEPVRGKTVSELAPGERGVICRFLQTSPETLVFFSEHELSIGTEIELVFRSAPAGITTIRGPLGEISLGTELSASIQVRPAD